MSAFLRGTSILFTPYKNSQIYFTLTVIADHQFSLKLSEFTWKVLLGYHLSPCPEHRHIPPSFSLYLSVTPSPPPSDLLLRKAVFIAIVFKAKRALLKNYVLGYLSEVWGKWRAELGFFDTKRKLEDIEKMMARWWRGGGVVRKTHCRLYNFLQGHYWTLPSKNCI